MDTPKNPEQSPAQPQYPTPYAGYSPQNTPPQQQQFTAPPVDPKALTMPEKQLLYMLVHRYKEEIPQLRQGLIAQLEQAKNRNAYDPMNLMNMQMNGNNGLNPDQTIHMAQQNIHILDQAIPIVDNILRMDKLV